MHGIIMPEGFKERCERRPDRVRTGFGVAEIQFEQKEGNMNKHEAFSA
jgi:hypothetical protein